MICDFCSRPNPTREIRQEAESAVVVELPSVAPAVDVSGSWWACEDCAVLVDREDLEALLDHVIASPHRAARLTPWQTARFREALAVVYTAVFALRPKEGGRP